MIPKFVFQKPDFSEFGRSLGLLTTQYFMTISCKNDTYPINIDKDHPNMFGDISEGSGLSSLTRDEDHALAFLTKHQETFPSA